MPDPAYLLPPELFAVILDFALQDESDDGLDYKSDDEADAQSAAKRLYDLSLLNRGWYTALVSRTYAKWTYNGAKHTFMMLWRFFRTVRSNPHLAAQVRTLNISNWKHSPWFYRGEKSTPPIEFSPDELELVQSAIHEAGISQLEASIMEALRKRDRRPLMALLLTSLPNLSVVYAHVPLYDPVLGAVLTQMMDRQKTGRPSSALHELREIHLFREIEIPHRITEEVLDDEPDGDPPESSLYIGPNGNDICRRLNYLWPLYYLPGLRTLSLFLLDKDEDDVRSHMERTVFVTGLKSVYLIGYRWSLRRLADIQAITTRPAALEHFSFYLDGIPPYDRRSGPPISNTEIWGFLRNHKHSLESIEIYREGNLHPMSPFPLSLRSENGEFGRLCIFTSLKHLVIQTRMLLDWCCGSSRAPSRLKDTLSSTLESLTLIEEGDSDLITDLPALLRQVTRRDFPHLSSIVLMHKLYLQTPADDDLAQEDKDLKQSLMEIGVRFRVVRYDSLPVHGIWREMWEETRSMRYDE